MKKSKIKSGFKVFNNFFWKFILIVIGLGAIYKFIDKSSLMGVINRNLAGEEAGLMAGILLGDNSGLKGEMWEMLKASGLLHIVVASGSNVMLISRGVIEKGAKLIGRKMAIAVGLGLLWWYCSLTEWQAPILRAVVLMSLIYMAQAWGRMYDWKRGLAVVVLMLAVADIKTVTGVSFWLSMAAFLAITLIPKKWGEKIIWGDFMVTVWIGLFVTPILAYVFGEISLISPLTNALVLGLVGVISVVGFVGVIGGLFIPVLGRILLWLCWPGLRYIVGISRLGEWGMVSVRFNLFLLIGWYLLLAYWLIRLKNEDENVAIG